MKILELSIDRHTANTKREDGDNNIIGDFKIDGHFFCYSLEDQKRFDGKKVPGETAIKAGRYKVVLTMSNRFKRIMPLLLNVPNFEGVRLHGGNTSKDTQGCPLIAFNTDKVKIWGSAEKELTSRLQKFIKDNPDGEIWITIKDKFLSL